MWKEYTALMIEHPWHYKVGWYNWWPFHICHTITRLQILQLQINSGEIKELPITNICSACDLRMHSGRVGDKKLNLKENFIYYISTKWAVVGQHNKMFDMNKITITWSKLKVHIHASSVTSFRANWQWVIKRGGVLGWKSLMLTLADCLSEFSYFNRTVLKNRCLTRRTCIRYNYSNFLKIEE